MACGWFLALMLATMPLFGVSDYRKFAICLPFEIGDSISLGKNFYWYAPFWSKTRSIKISDQFNLPTGNIPIQKILVFYSILLKSDASSLYILKDNTKHLHITHHEMLVKNEIKQRFN